LYVLVWIFFTLFVTNLFLIAIKKKDPNM